MFEHRSIMFSAFLLTTLFMALFITASPVDVRNCVITLPITRRINTCNGTMNILEHDQARAAALKGISARPLDRRITSDPIVNVAFNYVANVAIGNIHRSCKFNLEREIAAANVSSYTDELIIDTGSANTWVGANKQYVETSTSVNTGKEVRIPYGAIAEVETQHVVGTLYLDLVDLGNGLLISNQPIGVASNEPRIRGADGVLGLGPVQLTQGTLPDEPLTTTIPTVTRNLYNQQIISRQIVGISFNPMSSTDIIYGQRTFGGTTSITPIRY